MVFLPLCIALFFGGGAQTNLSNFLPFFLNNPLTDITINLKCIQYIISDYTAKEHYSLLVVLNIFKDFIDEDFPKGKMLH